MGHDEVIALLRQHVARAGSQGKAAVALGLQQGQISAVLNHHQKPGPCVLAALGLRKVVSYEPIPPRKG